MYVHRIDCKIITDTLFTNTKNECIIIFCINFISLQTLIFVYKHLNLFCLLKHTLYNKHLHLFTQTPSYVQKHLQSALVNNYD